MDLVWLYLTRTVLFFHFQIPPLTRVDIQAGDKMGFLSEGTDSGVVYDFQPNEYGATTRTRSFPSTPVAGESYDFDAIPYNTYVFAFSVLIDTGIQCSYSQVMLFRGFFKIRGML